MIGSALDQKGHLGHSPPMRWLLLINLLAVVLLSGAVAIVIEGTPVGSPVVSLDEQPEDEEKTTEIDEVFTSQGDDLPSSEIPAELVTETRAPEPIAVTENTAGDEGIAGQIQREDVLVAAPDAPIPRPAPRENEALNADEELQQAVTEQAVDPTPIVPEHAPLRIPTEGAFPPFNFLDADGKPAGYDIDVAKELCQRLQRQCVFEVRQWAELKPSLRRGDVDIIAASMRIPSNLPEGIIFTDPYYGASGRFVVSRDAGIAGPGMLQTSGSQVAVQAGSLHEAYLIAQYSEVELVTTKSLDAALGLVSSGAVEAAFGDNAAILRWLNEETCCAALGPALSDTIYFGDGIGLVLRNDSKHMADELNQHLKNMRADGTGASLSARYFSGSIF